MIHLNNMTKKGRVLIVAGGIVLIIILMLTVIGEITGVEEYFVGRDTYQSFGNGRFQAFDPGDEMYIQDLDRPTMQIDVERYVLLDDLLFIRGYYLIGYGQTADDERVINSYYPDDELHTYSSLDEIPYYSVINIESADVEFFLKGDTLPVEYQSVFDKPLNWLCKYRRNCFEKDLLGQGEI